MVSSPVKPEPFRPVWRVMLLNGGDDRYLRHVARGPGGQGAREGEMADHALWWPPTKIAGRCLSAYFLGRDEGHAIQRFVPTVVSVMMGPPGSVSWMNAATMKPGHRAHGVNLTFPSPNTALISSTYDLAAGSAAERARAETARS